MKIAIFGATGRVGRMVTALALRDGHTVKALVRTPDKLKGLADSSPGLTLAEGNAASAEALAETVSGADAVISALSTDGGSLLSDSFPLILEAMKRLEIKRIVAIGTAGVLDSRTEPGLLRYQSSESRRTLTRAAEEHHAVLRLLEESELDWTLVCPTYLPDGPAEGGYRSERGYLPENGTRITTGDTAEFAYAQLFSSQYVRMKAGIAY
ncbi:NAD(P)-dependent oxidoreductase [Paenibacillus sp. JDR-2]|uniref:NAD(P)-dependent oxidoreductase n=1 Tax=Paenibacillus sp. (strain JDR-2) TaxID=324057 RepID=UPI000166AD18|nr:SDR family oxidoreductase [Paenibacillus sp. JDR-2]ACT04568.1 NmrA family protein [Paenibacillus sp. JDR-2]